MSVHLLLSIPCTTRLGPFGKKSGAAESFLVLLLAGAERSDVDALDEGSL